MILYKLIKQEREKRKKSTLVRYWQSMALLTDSR
jgi:hypothetical protein